MPKRKFVVGLECKRLLEEAVAKHLPVTLTYKCADSNTWQVFKSNFISLQAGRVVISLPMPDQGDCHMEPALAQEIAITFKKGYNKCLFVTRILTRDRTELEPGIYIPIMTLGRPEQIEKIQRRAYNRVSIPTDERVPVQFWLTESSPETPYEGRLVNLSAGGLGVAVPVQELPNLIEGEQFIVQFVPFEGHEPLCLNTRYRHATDPAPAADESVLGFQILGLEINEEGRQLLRRLSRVVGVFQRRNELTQEVNPAESD